MPTARQAFRKRVIKRTFNARIRREAAQDFRLYASDIATPLTLADGSPFTLPGNARLGLSCNANVAAGAITVTTNRGRSLTTPALLADQKFILPYLERGEAITVHNSGSGTTSLYVVNEWNKFFKITNAFVNLLTNQDVTNAFWTKTNYTVSSPDTVMEVAVTGAHSMSGSLARAAGISTYHVSAKFKAIGPIQYLNLGLFSAGFGAGATMYFDITAGTTNSTGPYGGWSIANMAIGAADGLGFHLVSFDAITDAATTGLIYDIQGNMPEGTFSFAGDITKGFKVKEFSLAKA